MLLEIVFLGVFCMAIGIIVYSFLKMNSQLRNSHKFAINNLMVAFERNQEQIYSREENLHQYNFLKYNLNEALVVQKSIQLHTS